MPTYELALMLRTMPRPDLISTITRTSHAIFARGGFLRKIESMGEQKLAFKINKNSQRHLTGNAWIITFDVPPKSILDLKEEYTRDVDILRKDIFKKEAPVAFKCTLESELKPPAYRPEVIEMMEIAAKKTKEKYPHKTGLKYYPFQK